LAPRIRIAGGICGIIQAQLGDFVSDLSEEALLRSRFFQFAGLMILVMHVLVSCSSVAPSTFDVNTNVNYQEAFNLLESGALMLDVRTIEEWDEGHIPGATLIPLDQLGQRVNELPTKLPVVVYCRSGNRSRTALGILQSAGITNVHNMVGGINVWKDAGLATE
jgi:rhodanese-related sulfurtransferase